MTKAKRQAEVKADKKPGFIERFVIRLIVKKVTKKLDNMKGIWKTTLFGILTLLSAIAAFGKALLDGDPTTQPDFEAILAALAGIGLIFARDNGVTSEEAGAK